MDKGARGLTRQDIQDRVDTEDLYTNCKGYPLTKKLKGRAGNPIPAKVECLFKF